MSHRTATKALHGTLTGIETSLAWSRDETCCAAFAESVSRWSVLEQLEHLALADGAILQFLVPPDSDSQPAGGGGPNTIGHVVLATGRIPRGRGRAPEFTVPGSLSRVEVEARFVDLLRQYGALRESLPMLAQSRTRYPHPALGQFTPAQWLRFVDIHHRHHEAIIRDILRRTGGRR